MICTPHQTVFGWSTRGWDRWVV